MIRWIESLQRLRGWRRALLVLLCGLLTALSLPPFGGWPLMFAGLPLFLLVLPEAARGRDALWLGWLFGMGYFVFAFHWIGFAFLVDAATYLWMMPFMVGGLAAGMAVYWALAGWAVWRLGLRGLALAFGFAVALAIVEWLRGHLFTGFPWAAPGLAVDGMGAVAQLASLIGMPGLTLLLVAIAGAPAAWLVPSSRRAKGMALLVLALLPLGWAWGAARLSTVPVEPTGGRSIRIVQPNIAQEQKWREDNARTIFDQLKSLSTGATEAHGDGLASVDYLLWPESAVPFLIDESDVARDELRRMLAGHTVLMTGALRREGKNVFNSIITFDGDAQVAARYDKWRLVPGGEFLPFEWLLEPLGFRKVVTVPGSFAAGPGPVTLELPGGLKAAMLVCYEAIFPHALVDPARRPEVLVNVTNDGWFGRSTGPYQHLAQARLRAIEQGLPLIRAANTGISAVISPYGEIRERLPLMTQGVIDATLPAALEPTPYGIWGDWMLVFLAVTLALATFASRGWHARRELGQTGASMRKLETTSE